VAASTAGGRTEMPHQHLFSIYVHAPPDYKGEPACDAVCCAVLCCALICCALCWPTGWLLG
jgi:hypothetical protein